MLLLPEEQFIEEQWGLEDPRIVWLEEDKCYAITYVALSKGRPLVSLALTENLKEFVKYGPLLPPEDKDVALFPRLFKVGRGRRYALTHRPNISGFPFHPTSDTGETARFSFLFALAGGISAG